MNINRGEAGEVLDAEVSVSEAEFSLEVF
jgi:hypothetical protein